MALMDQYDVNRPIYGPRSGDIKFRWSVGVYYHDKRTVIAWFEHIDDAAEFLVFCRKAHPTRFYDMLQSVF